MLEASIADQAKGGLGNFPTTLGRPAGMPNMMMAFGPLEFVVTPETTYILIGWHDHYRRIFTDGRDWPADIEPTFSGYSIGKWIDEDGDGRYDVLEVETRGFKGPRAFDETGLPLHVDNQSIFKERIYRDKADPHILHDEITTIDHALTRPWTVDKRYVRNPNPRPDWSKSSITSENNAQIEDRQGELFSQRRRPADAGQEGPAAARSAVFHAAPGRQALSGRICSPHPLCGRGSAGVIGRSSRAVTLIGRQIGVVAPRSRERANGQPCRGGACRIR